MTGHMINFRVRDADLAAIDSAAKNLGQSRSDFIRDAINEKLGVVAPSATPVSVQSSRGKAKSEVKNPTQPFPDCPKNIACDLVKLPTGIKVCQTCAARVA